MPRKRSIIIDSGIVYAQVDTVANANSITTIAGGSNTKQIKIITIKDYNLPVSKFNATNAWTINKNIIITSITAECRGQSSIAPTGGNLTTRVRRGAITYSGIVPSLTTLALITIPAATSSVTSTGLLFAFAGDDLYFDVTEVGLTRPGLGLRLLVTYY